MNKKTGHCQLFVILARDANKAVIFRRGPRLWTQLILWDTQKDTFTEGQWFKGTLYLQRCDLSPDGSKLIYFAAKHYKKYILDASYDKPFSKPNNTWTAVSRPPYLTSLATATAHGTWDGGGYFGDDNTVYINQALFAPYKANVPPVEVERINAPQGVEFRHITSDGGFYSQGGLYMLLLERRGWQPFQADGELYNAADVDPAGWRKDNPDHTYRLSMMHLDGVKRRGTYQFTLRHLPTDTKIDIEVNESADWDQRVRLVYTHEGKLFVGRLRNAHLESIQLADFNANQVRLIESPAWAKTWDQPHNS